MELQCFLEALGGCQGLQEVPALEGGEKVVVFKGFSNDGGGLVNEFERFGCKTAIHTTESEMGEKFPIPKILILL